MFRKNGDLISAPGAKPPRHDIRTDDNHESFFTIHVKFACIIKFTQQMLQKFVTKQLDNYCKL